MTEEQAIEGASKMTEGEWEQACNCLMLMAETRDEFPEVSGRWVARADVAEWLGSIGIAPRSKVLDRLAELIPTFSHAR